MLGARHCYSVLRLVHFHLNQTVPFLYTRKRGCQESKGPPRFSDSVTSEPESRLEWPGRGRTTCPLTTAMPPQHRSCSVPRHKAFLATLAHVDQPLGNPQPGDKDPLFLCQTPDLNMSKSPGYNGCGVGMHQRTWIQTPAWLSGHCLASGRHLHSTGLRNM